MNDMNRMQVGLFFYVNDEFLFSGCAVSDAEKYGDFLIYPRSHYEIWDSYNFKVDYDYHPRGRVVYRKTDDAFIIYHDRCISEEILMLAEKYEGKNVKLELDEHYCCHKCNANYVL